MFFFFAHSYRMVFIVLVVILAVLFVITLAVLLVITLAVVLCRFFHRGFFY